MTAMLRVNAPYRDTALPASPPTAVPATIAGNGNWQSGIITPYGADGILVAANLTGNATVAIQRYADLAGTLPVDAGQSQALTGGTAGSIGVNDGVPYLSYQVTITDTSGSTNTVTSVAITQGKGV